ncbi:hypothetical protein ACFL4G_04980 [Thermodesulfobacteriota bacterium]
MPNTNIIKSDVFLFFFLLLLPLFCISNFKDKTNLCQAEELEEENIKNDVILPSCNGDPAVNVKYPALLMTALAKQYYDKCVRITEAGYFTTHSIGEKKEFRTTLEIPEDYVVFSIKSPGVQFTGKEIVGIAPPSLAIKFVDITDYEPIWISGVFRRVTVGYYSDVGILYVSDIHKEK